MKCALRSRVSFALKIHVSEFDVADKEIVEAALVSLQASIASSGAACVKLRGDCDTLGQKIAVQQERIEAHRANLDRVEAKSKTAENELSTLLVRYRLEMQQLDEIRRERLGVQPGYKRSRPNVSTSTKTPDVDDAGPSNRPALKRARKNSIFA
ncbi:hypothetical protein C8Q79DRAFT_1007523 [Trametes meyenii]|nr:hypothetical protein C8Q79DRAFT_1007523 [Trametes meyenii]